MHGLQGTPTARPAGKKRDPARRAAGQSSTASSRTWRQLLVWLHVLSSVSWMSQAIVMCTLLGISAASPAGELKGASAHVAELLDVTVLTSSANMSAFTGFALAATTTWGYFHHWWVATKFVITFGQLYLGIFVLSAAMPDVLTAASRGEDGPAASVALGAGLMAGALAFQAWLSVAKPWGRTPLAARARTRPSTAPRWLLALTVLVPIIDIPFGILIIDRPLPALSLAILAIALVARTRQHHRAVHLRRATSASS